MGLSVPAFGLKRVGPASDAVGRGGVCCPAWCFPGAAAFPPGGGARCAVVAWPADGHGRPCPARGRLGFGFDFGARRRLRPGRSRPGGRRALVSVVRRRGRVAGPCQKQQGQEQGGHGHAAAFAGHMQFLLRQSEKKVRFRRTRPLFSTAQARWQVCYFFTSV